MTLVLINHDEKQSEVFTNKKDLGKMKKTETCLPDLKENTLVEEKTLNLIKKNTLGVCAL